MPIVQRPPEPPPPVAACPGIGDIALHGPPGVLLHPGGPWAPLERPDPDVALAAAAELLVRLLARPARRPYRWTAPAFAREVELVRSHLRPIGTRGSLAASFGREAFHGPKPGRGPELATAVQVAYAIRWLELGDGGTWPGWRSLFADPNPGPVTLR
jgi:hypothetical protein